MTESMDPYVTCGISLISLMMCRFIWSDLIEDDEVHFWIDENDQPGQIIHH